MGQYVSPFGNNTTPTPSDGSKPRSTNYISPFEGSQYTEDYWRKKQQSDQAAQQDAQKQQKIKVESEQRKADEDKKKEVENDLFGRAIKDAGNFTAAVNEKVLGGVTRTVVKGVNAVATGFNLDEAEKRTKEFLKTTGQTNDKGQSHLASGKGVDRDSVSFQTGEASGDTIKNLSGINLPADIYHMGENAYKQAEMGQEGASDYRTEQLMKARDRFADEDLASGAISKEEHDRQKAENKTRLDNANRKTVEIEKKYGRKYDQDQGAVDALSTITSIDLPYTLIKGGIKVGGSLLGKLGKKASGDELTTAAKLADNIANDVDAPLAQASASKPEPSIAPPDATPIEAPTIPKPTEKRSANYTLDAAKPRVSSQEATEKLQRAGYTTDESKRILEDVLPEKGLSMPGSPKKIGYNEDRILEAANEFDNTPPLGEVKSSNLVDEIAARYNTVDDYINEATENAWNQNKKGAGTSIVTKHTDETGVGSDSLKGTRVSENNPYYRAVFEETGRAPTKSKIKQDVTDFLNGKDNNAKYLLDQDERGVADLIKERELGLSKKTDIPYGANTPDGSNLNPLAVQAGGEKGTSRLAASTKNEALKEKLIKKTLADTVDTPQYNKANMKQQAEYATNLIKSAPEDAVDIAMGRKAPPEHILQQMVYNAVEDHAKKIGGDKGANLLLELSRSRQSTNLTKMGQEIRAAAERDPHSPVTMVNEIKLARAEAAKKRGKDFGKSIKSDTDAVKKVTPKIKKEDWESFIKGLEC